MNKYKLLTLVGSFVVGIIGAITLGLAVKTHHEHSTLSVIGAFELWMAFILGFVYSMADFK